MASEKTDLLCPGCSRPMRTNGLTMFCETEGCDLNMFKPSDGALFTVDLQSLAPEEIERIYREGVADYHAGKEFHEGPYAKSGADVSDAEYQRGYEWRRGWNDAALGKA